MRAAAAETAQHVERFTNSVPEAGSELVRFPRVRALLELFVETGKPQASPRLVFDPMLGSPPRPSPAKSPGQNPVVRSLLSSYKHGSDEAFEDLEFDDEEERLSGGSAKPERLKATLSRSSDGAPQHAPASKPELKIDFGSRKRNSEIRSNRRR